MLDRSSFLDRPQEVVRVHGPRLASLVGSKLDETWVAWDTSSDTWLADEAVILVFGEVRLEIVWYKFDQVAISWNRIDVGARPAWLAEWPRELELVWRRDALPALRAVLGRTLTGVSIVEQQSVFVKPVCLLNGLEFRFGQQCLSIHNALDENGVDDRPAAEGPQPCGRIEL